MPGGRGILKLIAEALNNRNARQIANAFIMKIDAGYRISDANVTQIGEAFEISDHPDLLLEVYCHASAKDLVDEESYNG